MSFEEIVEEVRKLTTEEKKNLRELLDSELSWTEDEPVAEEDIGSREEGQSISRDLDRQIWKHGLSATDPLVQITRGF